MKILNKEKLKDNIMKNLRRDLDGGYIGGADILVYQSGETLFRHAEGFFDAKSEHAGSRKW